MPTVIKGQPTSKEVIAKLKDYGKPVLLAFSCGKDSLATWIALEEGGVEVVPCYLWIVPNLEFVNEELDYFEEFFQTEIHYYPHPAFYMYLRNATAQAPERLSIIEAMNIPKVGFDDVWKAIRADLELDGSWVADGVRAADSIVRRASFVKHGVMKEHSMKVSPIADWLKGEVIEAINRRGVKLPIDYRLFNRSFDGLDYRFIEPLKRELPNDYRTMETWFPLLEADIVRHNAYGG